MHLTDLPVNYNVQIIKLIYSNLSFWDLIFAIEKKTSRKFGPAKK